MNAADSPAEWLRLTLIPGIGGETQRKLLQTFGHPEAIFRPGRSEDVYKRQTWNIPAFPVTGKLSRHGQGAARTRDDTVSSEKLGRGEVLPAGFLQLGNAQGSFAASHHDAGPVSRQNHTGLAARSLGPVSYTHLDVYKRQARASGSARRARRKLPGRPTTG